jgi:murein tripeptide amidase MpaA
MHIDSAFDSGNVVVVQADAPEAVELEIRPDAGGDHFQWFHFRVTGARGTPLRLRLGNAAQASYPDGWKDYRACASYDRSTWFRVDTSFDGVALTIDHTPELDCVSYAYFAPYTLDQHQDLVAAAACLTDAEVVTLGRSVEGRSIDLLRLGPADADGRLKLWIIARQHPGETMAEWLMEGLIEHLADEDEPASRKLREQCTFYLVPNMNPDGSVLGHLRNNAAGANLNRAWQAPSAERSPEVFHVRQAMEATGVDFFLDVHGDEALPYNFLSGAEGIPSWTEGAAARQRRYAETLAAINPDFQTTHGYPVAAPGQANLTMASNWVAERFGCLSLTLEQPFKDTANAPHERGWCPERATKLGRDQLLTLHAVLDCLR